MIKVQCDSEKDAMQVLTRLLGHRVKAFRLENSVYALGERLAVDKALGGLRTGMVFSEVGR